MKFGRHLLTNLTPEWKSQYVPYDYMKKLLDQAVDAAPVIIEGQDNSAREQYFLLADEAFFEVRDIAIYYFITINFFLISSIVKSKK